MSITINIYYSGKEGNAKKFAQKMHSKGIVDAIREAEGNLRYEYFIPLNDETTILLVDTWTNQQAIDTHHASSMMQEIIDLREKYDLTMRVERYTSDEEGVPESDKKFIRE